MLRRASWPRAHFPGESAGTGWLAARWPGMQVAPDSSGVSGAPDRARRLTEEPPRPPFGARVRVAGWGDQPWRDCANSAARPPLCPAVRVSRAGLHRVSGEPVGTPSDPS